MVSANTPSNIDEAISRKEGMPGSFSQSMASLGLSLISCGLPAFFYLSVLQSWSLSPAPFAYVLPAALVLSSLFLFLSYSKQTKKTYVRYAEEIRESGYRPSNLKKDEMPSESERNSVIWSHSMSYAFTVINVIFFALFFLCHYKVFMGMEIPPEVRFAGSVGIPALVCLIIS